MNETQTSEEAGRRPVYSAPPPKPKRSIPRFLATCFVVALFISGILIGFFFLYIEPTYLSQEEEQTVYYVKSDDRIIPYPDTPQEAAARFGGDPSDWYQADSGAWVYDSGTPLDFTIGKNVTVYMDHVGFYWE